MRAVVGLALATPGTVQARSLPCVEQISEHFGAGRFVDAARAAEACWEAEKAPELLFFAAQARANAGHVAHAVALFRRYLASDAASSHADAIRLLKDVASQAAVLTVRGAGKRLWAEYLDEERDPLVLDLPEEEAGERGALVRLDRGRWRLRVEDASGQSHVREVALGAGASSIDFPASVVAPTGKGSVVRVRVEPERAVGPGATLRLESDAPNSRGRTLALPGPRVRLTLPPGTWRLRLEAGAYESGPVSITTPASSAELVLAARRTAYARGWLGTTVALSLGTAGLLAGAVPLMVMGHARQREGARKWSEGEEPAVAMREFLLGLQRQSAGVIMLGAAGGAGIVAVSGSVRWNRKVLAAEAGVGGAVTLGAIVGVALVRRSYSELEIWEASQAEQWTRTYRSDLATSALLGFGVGMLTASAVSLIVQRATRGRTRARALARRAVFSANPGGLALAGRF